MANNLDDRELSEFPIHSVNEQVMCLDQNTDSNNHEVVVNKPPIVQKADLSNPEGATEW